MIQLLADENLPTGDFATFKASFLDLLPELKAQAEWSLSNYEYPTHAVPAPLEMHASPVGRMDPFTNVGQCSAPTCRGVFARRFGQTFGLYADRISVADPFTLEVLLTKRWTQQDLIELQGNLAVLYELLPMIRAGIIQFRDRDQIFCKGCYSKFKAQLEELTDEIMESVAQRIAISEYEGMLVIDCEEFHSPSLSIRLPKRVVKRRLDKGLSLPEIGLESFRGLLFREIESTFFGLVDAAEIGSVVMADSRVGFSAVLRLEKQHKSSIDPLQAIEMERSATLPWVSNLTVEQIIQLRQEAATAIPRLRAQMASALCRDPNNLGVGPASYLDWMNQLREESAEVEAELRAIGGKSERWFHSTMGLLGLGIAVCAFADSPVQTQSLVGGLGALMTTLSLIHPYRKDDEQEERKLMTKPGYVLVKAREILAHSH